MQANHLLLSRHGVVVVGIATHPLPHQERANISVSRQVNQLILIIDKKAESHIDLLSYAQ